MIGFVIASCAKDIAFMAGIGKMHAGWNGRAQIGDCIMWLLCGQRWDRCTNAADRLIGTHFTGCYIVEGHMLWSILIVVRQWTSSLVVDNWMGEKQKKTWNNNNNNSNENRLAWKVCNLIFSSEKSAWKYLKVKSAELHTRCKGRWLLPKKIMLLTWYE